MSIDAKHDQLVDAFVKTLNIHGHAFQYAVLAELERLFKEQGSGSAFYFEVAEFPVQVQDTPTRIDFVLRHVMRRLYLACECKRANPALSNWCFVRAPMVRRDRDEKFVFIEKLRRTAVNAFEIRGAQYGTQKPIFHFGIEVKTGEKGEGAPGRSAIE